MAGKPMAGESFSASLAGMSKNQLYDIMSQMKNLIEQNQQQARQILIQNPLLTRALFQAQIMLGMVQAPEEVPKIKPAASQHLQQPVLLAPQPSVQAGQSTPVQVSLQDQTSASHTQIPMRKQQQNQPAMTVTSASGPTLNLQPPSLPLHAPLSAQQPKGHLSAQSIQMSLPQSSQIPNIAPLPLHSASQPPTLHQPQMSTTSSQLQQPQQTSGIPHLPLQPPLPPQPRPPSMPTFHHQPPQQMGPSMGFQHSGTPQMHHSQPMFHSGAKPPASIGSPFLQGQPPLPSHSQLPPQSLYQAGGLRMGPDYTGGSSMRVESGSSWMPGPPESTTVSQLPGPPPLVPGQMGPGNQPPRPPPLTAEMEKALLQQVMSLTPDQINLLPPEQRHQVLQLQQMLRQ